MINEKQKDDEVREVEIRWRKGGGDTVRRNTLDADSGKRRPRGYRPPVTYTASKSPPTVLFYE